MEILDVSFSKPFHAIFKQAVQIKYHTLVHRLFQEGLRRKIHKFSVNTQTDRTFIEFEIIQKRMEHKNVWIASFTISWPEWCKCISISCCQSRKVIQTDFLYYVRRNRAWPHWLHFYIDGIIHLLLICHDVLVFAKKLAQAKQTLCGCNRCICIKIIRRSSL